MKTRPTLAGVCAFLCVGLLSSSLSAQRTPVPTSTKKTTKKSTPAPGAPATTQSRPTAPVKSKSRPAQTAPRPGTTPRPKPTVTTDTPVKSSWSGPETAVSRDRSMVQKSPEPGRRVLKHHAAAAVKNRPQRISAMYRPAGTTTSLADAIPDYLDGGSMDALAQIYGMVKARTKNGQAILTNWMSLATGVGNVSLNYDPQHTSVVQALQVLPVTIKAEIKAIVDEQVGAEHAWQNPQQIQFWTHFQSLYNRSSSCVQLGKSWGEPHLQTFDGLKYDLQSVGEFVLCKSDDGAFEVQSRQAVSRPNFSMNIGAAMNVRGDRVCLYVGQFPDEHRNTPLRINGEPYEALGDPILLPNGGVVSFGAYKGNGNSADVRVTWPTGEQVLVHFYCGRYMDIIPQIYCGNQSYSGLLGNANGNPKDDLMLREGRSLSPVSEFYTEAQISGAERVRRTNAMAEKYYKEQVAREFGNDWRITDQTSLFDYMPWEGTANFTDMAFPQEYITFRDFSSREREWAHRTCFEAGVSSDEMSGCVMDVAWSGDIVFASSSARLGDQEVILDALDIENDVRPFDFSHIEVQDVHTVSKNINRQQAREAREERLERSANKYVADRYSPSNGTSRRSDSGGGTVKRGSSTAPRYSPSQSYSYTSPSLSKGSTTSSTRPSTTTSRTTSSSSEHTRTHARGGGSSSKRRGSSQARGGSSSSNSSSSATVSRGGGTTVSRSSSARR